MLYKILSAYAYVSMFGSVIVSESDLRFDNLASYKACKTQRGDFLYEMRMSQKFKIKEIMNRTLMAHFLFVES